MRNFIINKNHFKNRRINLKDFLSKIICLCGSTKFKKEFEKTIFGKSLKGNIILSVYCFTHYDQIVLTEDQKILFNKLYKKIKISNEILVINPNNYIGESTKREIEYAKELNKVISHKYTFPGEK